MTGDREACLKAGMDGYISKPINAAELFGTLELIFPNRGGIDAPPRPVAPRLRPRAEVLDVARLEQTMEGDAAMLQEVIEVYLQDLPKREKEMLDALARGDAPTLARAAHTMKSVLQTLAATPAADVALRLEILARCANLAEAEGLVTELRNELALLSSALRELIRKAA
jgi:HPt (histidine-containing phosphotransfer) domain-containing protein